MYDIKSYEEIDQIQLPKIDFTRYLKQKFKESIVTNGNHLSVISSDFKIYCGTESKPTSVKEIDIYGEKGFLEIKKLARENDWKIFDKVLNKFLELNS